MNFRQLFKFDNEIIVLVYQLHKFLKNNKKTFNVNVVNSIHQWLILVVVKYYSQFKERQTKIRNQVEKESQNINSYEIIYSFDWFFQKDFIVFESSLSNNLIEFRLNCHFFIASKLYKFWIDKQQKFLVKKKSSLFDRFEKTSIFNLTFVNESFDFSVLTKKSNKSTFRLHRHRNVNSFNFYLKYSYFHHWFNEIQLSKNEICL